MLLVFPPLSFICPFSLQSVCSSVASYGVRISFVYSLVGCCWPFRRRTLSIFCSCATPRFFLFNFYFFLFILFFPTHKKKKKKFSFSFPFFFSFFFFFFFFVSPFLFH